MTIQSTLANHVKAAVKKAYDVEIENFEFQPTRKDFEGDITLVTFPMLKTLRTNPVKLGEEIGTYLTENVSEVSGFNVVKGFLNIVLSDAYFLEFFNGMKDREDFGILPPAEDAKGIMVEYSSPNTNKPLHLGHIRNILLGFSVAEILNAAGNKSYKTQIINDRGIHICKSMLAWERFGNGETPESTGLKGDKLVGNYYVKFEKEFQVEFDEWIEQLTTPEIYEDLNDVVNSKETQDFLQEKVQEYFKQGYDLEDEDVKAKIFNKIYKQAVKRFFKNHFFNNYSKLGREVQRMLSKWEAGDSEVVALWEKMNQWVYQGFEKTYDSLGVDFDKNYYESDTYLLGKDVVNQGLEKGVFYKKEDGSVWIDLTDEGLDEKIVLRSDGTAVYMTQDIGTAIQRVKDFDISGMVYTVGNEQDYHFKVLFLILKKLGFDWADYLYHLSYGMVDLPSGKMKSREGTVVDADDLIAEMAETAKNISEELGKLDGYTELEKEELYKIIGLGALKYYILKVDPKKRILFNPEESVDFQGNTGPFIQYTYARIQSIIRKADFDFKKPVEDAYKFHEKERSLIKQLQLYPETIQLAAENHSPALIANYTYELVKEFNSFYQNITILGTEDITEKTLRVQLANSVGSVIKSSFDLLGIQVPERM